MATDRARQWVRSGGDNRLHHPRRVITPQQTEEIRTRAAAGESLKDLALEYGVSVRTIRHYAT
ncbi:Hin recombinase [Streptomyces sp. NPDC087866]|uniref:Hin recombinase n=1 Tax=Streptomyces sp. NPDC087866 TaxID=3365815 RepID=UPI0038061F2A